MVKRKGGAKKGQTLHLSDFLGDEAPQTHVSATTWSAEASTDLSKPDPVVVSTPAPFDISALPSAPRAQREGSFDPSKVPRSPPFTAFVGNLPFDFEDDDVNKLFIGIKVKEVRLLKEKDTGHFKGFGYVEFDTAEDLIAALKFNEKVVRNRPIKVDVAAGKDNRDRSEADSSDKWERGRSNEPGERKPYVDTTSDDWRRDTRPQDDGEPVPYQRAPRRYDDKDRSPKRYGGRGDSDNFSRDDFGTKMNEPAKESPAPRSFRDGHDDRGDRGAWRPRNEPQSEAPWVRHGDIGDEPRGRPRLNIKPRTVAPAGGEEKPASENSNKPNPFGAAKPVDIVERRDIVERERPDGAGAPPPEKQKPKANPFGSARPADTAHWKSSRAQTTGPIKTPTAQKIDDVSDEIITDSNKFMILNAEEPVE